MLKTVIATLALAAVALPAAAAGAKETPAAYAAPAPYETSLSPEDAGTLPSSPEKEDKPNGEHHRHHRHRDGGHRCPKHGGFLPPPPPADENAAVTTGIAELFLEKLTPEVIAVYETRIAGRPVVTGMSDAELELAASEAGVSPAKYRAILLLADLMARTSKPVPPRVLASLGDGELLRLARRHAKLYADSLTEEERDELKAEFKAAMKK